MSSLKTLSRVVLAVAIGVACDYARADFLTTAAVPTFVPGRANGASLTGWTVGPGIPDNTSLYTGGAGAPPGNIVSFALNFSAASVINQRSQIRFQTTRVGTANDISGPIANPAGSPPGQDIVYRFNVSLTNNMLVGDIGQFLVNADSVGPNAPQPTLVGGNYAIQVNPFRGLWPMSSLVIPAGGGALANALIFDLQLPASTLLGPNHSFTMQFIPLVNIPEPGSILLGSVMLCAAAIGVGRRRAKLSKASLKQATA